ncbi:demethoxyubiquinone hydroxylase family protein [Inquilinus limosus]|uniref:Demethoxyubiquinone hydroxylase family protein n=1 Tax=Inquilinus limosus TaxID=171674 RepID=A0A211ZEL8_9PROT|nr:demethoxyubiquinone hydroxylase family protein [Inquilinus limosus]OWJ63646.1 demethoxyubiquinone hydroxylase family protein [Inquilinus limosus]
MAVDDASLDAALAASPTAGVSRRDRLTIARILRVNHAGESGAIRIYGAQIAVARRLWPDLVPRLEAMRADEIRHCRLFRSAMPTRNSRPCRVMRLWSLGGFVLGFATALAGRRMVWICTAAVEAAVHRHLGDQLHFLAGKDDGVGAIIRDINVEEIDHLRMAEAQLGPGHAQGRLYAAIAAITDLLIWLSTWGDSARMARAISVPSAPGSAGR